jgi:hypothetical protein
MWILDPTTGELKQDENQDQGTDLSGSAGVGTSSSPAAGAAASTPAGPTESGMGFTDINKYLQLNAPQSQALGDKVVGGLEGKMGAANSALDQGQTAFNAALGQSAPKMSEEDINKLASDPTALIDFTGQKNPRRPMVGPDGAIPQRQNNNIQNFQSTAAGQYGGPNSFQDTGGYADLLKTVNSAHTAGENASKPGMQDELVREVYSDPSRAKQGMLSLDTALMNQTPGVAGRIGDAAKQAPVIEKRLGDIQTSSTDAITKQKEDIQARKDQINKAFLGEGGTYDRFKAGLTEKQVSTTDEINRSAAEARDITNLDKLLASGVLVKTPNPYGSADPYMGNDTYGRVDPTKFNPSQAALDQLGVTKEQLIDLLNKQASAAWRSGYLSLPEGTAASWTNKTGATQPSYMSDWSQYINTGSPDVSMGSVAGEQDFAQLAALEALMPTQIDENFITPSNPYQSDVTDFKYQDLLDYLNKELAWIEGPYSTMHPTTMDVRS